MMQKTHNHAPSNFIPSHNSPVDMSSTQHTKNLGMDNQIFKINPDKHDEQKQRKTKRLKSEKSR